MVTGLPLLLRLLLSFLTALVVAVGADTNVFDSGNGPEASKEAASDATVTHTRLPSFPDARRLEQLIVSDSVTDMVQIRLHADMSAAEQRACMAQIQEVAHCSRAEHLFRTSRTKYERHVRAGLTMWFRLECVLAAGGLIFAKGRGAQAAIGRLQAQVMENQLRLDDETREQEKNNNLLLKCFKMDFVEPEYEIHQIEAMPDKMDDSSQQGSSSSKRTPMRHQQQKRDEDLQHSDCFVPEERQHSPRDSADRRSTLVTGSTNDPLLSLQEHYNVIKVPAAWDVMNAHNAWTHAHDVTVQVVDTGWDLSHEDSGHNIWNNTNEICDDGIDNDENEYIDDCHGYNHVEDSGMDLLGVGAHGSHCAGTISANTDNGIGVAGIAGGLGGSKGVSIMTNVVFAPDQRRGFADALIYGADNGAHISSNSWAYSVPNLFQESIKVAIDYALDVGVVVVFAAGNWGKDGAVEKHYPAAYERVISVAAVDNFKVAAPFTNYGQGVDIAAPGVSVYSTGLANEYPPQMGTSMACPHVAGVLALGKVAKPTASAAELESCLFSSAENIDDFQTNDKYKNGELGHGLVDAMAFVSCVLDLTMPPTAVPAPTQSPAPTIASSASPTTCVPPFSCGDNCGDCNQLGLTRGCSCAACECQVCKTIDSYCCNIWWDYICANHAISHCSCTPQDDPMICPASCSDTPGPGCPNCPDCEEIVCSTNPQCCSKFWDIVCDDVASSECASSLATPEPSSSPSNQPSSSPSTDPTHRPSGNPSTTPSKEPSSLPSLSPSLFPSTLPSQEPSDQPSEGPSFTPTASPSTPPSPHPVQAGSEALAGSPPAASSAASVVFENTIWTIVSGLLLLL